MHAGKSEWGSLVCAAEVGPRVHYLARGGVDSNRC